MTKLNFAIAETDGVRLSALSPAGCRVLGLLDKGCAYQVHGGWRFRGRLNCVKELSFLSLLANGLAERVETDRHLQIRITAAGRCVRREIPRQPSPSHSEPRVRDVLRVGRGVPGKRLSGNL